MDLDRTSNSIKDLFKSSKRESAVDIVVSRIRTLLITRKLRSGDKLPTEIELAESLSVSRTAVREAMKILSAFGVVEIVQGDGTYIARHFSRKIFDPLIFSIILDLSNLDELVELRKVIECDVVRIIMQRNDPEVYEKLKIVVESAKNDYEESHDVISKSLEWDIAFHAALGEATKNRLLAKIYDFLVEIFLLSIQKNFATEKGGPRAYNYHHKMIQTMENGDIEEAFKVIDEIAETWKELVIEFRD